MKTETVESSQDEETIKFNVNGEEEVYAYSKPANHEPFALTVREILMIAGFTPVEKYELTRDKDNYKFNSLDEAVPVEYGESFTAKYAGETKVS